MDNKCSDASIGKPPLPPPPPLPPRCKIDSNTKDRMKKVNWQVISSQNMSKDCFWYQQGTNMLQENNDIFDRLTENFALPNKDVTKVIAVKSKIRLQVLDTNSAQNLLISLRTLSKDISPEQFKQHILRCDTSNLNPTFLEILIKILPAPHAIKQLYNMNNNGVELVDVEKFIACLGNIDQLVPRLQSINFKLGFKEMVNDLEPNIMTVIAACGEIISCTKFGQIVSLILSIGNRMNQGSNSCRATGFELGVLAKLQEVKNTTSKQTLLNFVVDTVARNYPELLNFAEELIHIESAARLNVNHIKETIHQVAISSENLRKLLKHANGYDKEDKFCEEMSLFSQECNDLVKVLQKKFGEMQTKYTKVGHFYAFCVDKCSMEEFFSSIQTFKAQFLEAYGEMCKTGVVEIGPPNRSSDIRSTGSVKENEMTVNLKKYDCKVKLKRFSLKEIADLTGQQCGVKRKRT